MALPVEPFARALRDLSDALDRSGIQCAVVAQPDFDREYMARWFEEFDLHERFRRIEATAKERDLLSESQRPCEPDQPAR